MSLRVPATKMARAAASTDSTWADHRSHGVHGVHDVHGVPGARRARRARHASLLVVASLLLALFFTLPARAEGEDQEAVQRAQVERLRGELANHLHLRAFDLLDELVLEWKKTPPFDKDTPVAIVDVTGPFGFGSGLEALIENHLADLLLRHGDTHVRLSHCPACRTVTVHSDARATVISRGVDQPEVLAEAGKKSGSTHALFLDFEAEGSALVLRARVTSLAPTLPIVYARTLSSSTSSAALLRTSDHLVTADEARAEYLDALQQRGPITLLGRLAVTRFAPPNDGVSLALPPLVWVQTGAELAINHSKAWLGSLVVGGAWLPNIYTGVALQSRIHRLVTGAVSSLTHPNVYLFGGASLVTLFGPSALVLRTEQPAVTDVVTAALSGSTPSSTYPAFQLGLDARIGNRLGGAFFVETTPTLAGTLSVGRYVDYGLLQIHSIGGEVSLCF